MQFFFPNKGNRMVKNAASGEIKMNVIICACFLSWKLLILLQELNWSYTSIQSF